ncbi:hypothetical protein ACHQM5_019328 [Ranunculus cassubicifolius]
MATLRTLRRIPPPPQLSRYANFTSSQTLEHPNSISSPLLNLSPIPDPHLINTIISTLNSNNLNSLSQFHSQLTPSIIVQVIYNCTGNLKLGQNFVDFLLKFEDFKHSEASLSSMIHILVRSKRLDQARVLILRIIGEGSSKGVDSLIETYYGCASDPFVFDFLIRTCVEVKRVTEAVEAFRILRSRGFVVPVNACNSLLGGLVKVGLNDLAWEIGIEVLGSETEVNVFTMNIMVNAMCKRRKLKHAGEFLLAMEKKGVFPDYVTYFTLINAHCSRGQSEEAIRLVGIMEAKGLRPGLEVYNNIITCLCKFEPEKYRAVEVTLADMPVIGLDPATTRGNGLAPNIVSFILLIGILLKGGETNRALVYCREINNHGLVPNSVIYTMLIGGLCRNGNVVEALKMFDEMVARGCVPDVITYNIILNGACKEKRLPQAEEIFGQMIQRASPDFYSYTTLIHGYCNEGDAEKALTLFRGMIKMKKNLKLQFSTLNILTDWFCKDSDMENVNELWNDVRSKGLCPSYIPYSILINGLCGKGHVSDAVKLCYDMIDDIRPNILTCNSVIKGFCLLGRSKKARKFLNKMIRNGFTPDGTTYNTLIEGFVKEANMHCALAFINKLQSRNLVIDVMTFNFLLIGLCQLGRMQDAEQVFRYMIEKGLQPDKLTYKSMISGHVSQSNLKEAFRYHGEMLQKGFLR